MKTVIPGPWDTVFRRSKFIRKLGRSHWPLNDFMMCPTARRIVDVAVILYVVYSVQIIITVYEFLNIIVEYNYFHAFFWARFCCKDEKYLITRINSLETS
jgi:hypothetical protein